MPDKTPLGHRYLPAANDIHAMAVIAGYENPVLNPLAIPDVAVPEPSSLLLSLGGLAFVIRRRRQPHGCD